MYKELLLKIYKRLKNREYIIHKLRTNLFLSEDELEDLGETLYAILIELEAIMRTTNTRNKS